MKAKEARFGFVNRRKKAIKINLADSITRFAEAKKLERRAPRTVETYLQALNQFSRWFAENGHTEVTTEVVKTFIHHLTFEKIRWDDHPTKPPGDAGLSPRAVNNLIRILKIFFNWLKSEKLTTHSPMSNISYQREPKNALKVFNDSDVRLLLSAPNRKVYTGFRDYCMMLVLCDGGPRIKELTSIRVCDVNLNLRHIIIHGENAKTGNTRFIPISIKTAKELERLIAYMDCKDTDYLWLTQFGERYFADTFAKMLKIYAKRVGVTGVRVSPHTFRHYMAVKYLRSGGDIVSLAQILGHASLDVTRIYLRYSNSDMQEKHDIASPVTNLLDKGNEKKRGNKRFM